MLNKVDLATDEQIAALEKAVSSLNSPNVKGMYNVPVIFKIITLIGILRVSADPSKHRTPECATHGPDEVFVNAKKKTWKCDECNETGALDFSPIGTGELVRHTMQLIPEITRYLLCN